jgi:uncharacterized protein
MMGEQNYLKLIPYGIQMSADGALPILLLKDEKGLNTMPVALNHLEAGITLTQSNKAIAPTTAHRVTEVLLHALDVKIEKCVFADMKGAHQYVHLQLIGHPSVPFIRVRADEAISLCLHLNVPFFATVQHMNQARVMSSEHSEQMKVIMANPDHQVRHHKYMM